MWVRCMCAFTMALALAAPAGAADPPSNKEPRNALRVHGKGLSEAEAAGKSLDSMLTECLALDKQADEAIALYEARRDSKTLDKIEPKAIAATWIRIDQLKRSAMRLRQLGEPAGIEIEFRYARHYGRISTLLEYYRNLKPIAELSKKALPQFQAEGKKQLGPLKDALALLAAGKTSQAEIKFYDIWDRLNTSAVFYKERDYFDVMKPYTDGKVEVEKAANKFWREQADSALADARDKQLPDYETTQKALANAAVELQKMPQVKLGDKMCTGPQAVQYFGEEWKRLHLAAYRCRALEWARGSVTKRMDETRISRLSDDDAKFTLEIIKGLSGLMAAEAQRVTDAEAPALYQQYLQELAPLSALQTDGRFDEAMIAGLEPLKNKSPALAAEVTAYQSATTELLWWRRQAAKAVFKTLQANFPSVQDRLTPGLITKGEFDRGLIQSATRDRGLNEAELRCTAQELIVHAWPIIENQRAHLLAISPVATKASSHYIARHYGIMDVSRLPPGRAESLRADLLLTDKAGALTLEGATAAYAVGNGYYEAVGGEISAFYLDSLIVSFASLTPKHWAMTMLDPLASEQFAGDLLSQMVVRCDLRPTWVYHEYFVSDLPPPAK